MAKTKHKIKKYIGTGYMCSECKSWAPYSSGIKLLPCIKYPKVRIIPRRKVDKKKAKIFEKLWNFMFYEKN